LSWATIKAGNASEQEAIRHSMLGSNEGGRLYARPYHWWSNNSVVQTDSTAGGVAEWFYAKPGFPVPAS
jgi:hypothetical protein